jgi:hypothetical protein
VIRFGDLVFSGTADELLAGGHEHLDVGAEDPRDTGRLHEALARAGWAVTGLTGGDGGAAGAGGTPGTATLRVAGPVDRAGDVNRVAAAAGVTLAALVPARETLEEVFLRMTGDVDGELRARPAIPAEPSGAAR